LPQLGVHARAAVRPVRLLVDAPDPLHELHVAPRPRRGLTLQPRIVPAGGDLQHTAQRGHRILCLVRSHEPKESADVRSVSRANQAAAFARISRSVRRRRFSRLSRSSSSFSRLLSPSVRLPSSSSACFTQFRIACAEGSNSRDSSSAVRPARTNSTICRRNSGGYTRRFFAIVDSFPSQGEYVSTKPGQLQ